MYSQDNYVSDIIEDYLKEERNLDIKIQKCKSKRNNIGKPGIEEDYSKKNNNIMALYGRIDSNESIIRNQQFLKDLEEAKARLRTIASFTPTDQELRVLAGAYRVLLGGNVAQNKS